MHRRHEEARERRGARKERVAVEPGGEQIGDARDQPLAVAESEDVHERRQGRRVHARDVAADQQQRVALVAILAPHRDARGLERAQDVDDVHFPRERPGDQPEIRQRRARLEGDRGFALLVEEPLAGEIRDPVEEAIDPLEPEVGHPDLVGVRKAEGQTVGAEAVRLLREAFQGGSLPIFRCGSHAEQEIIAARSSRIPYPVSRMFRSRIPAYGPTGAASSRNSTFIGSLTVMSPNDGSARPYCFQASGKLPCATTWSAKTYTSTGS